MQKVLRSNFIFKKSEKLIVLTRGDKGSIAINGDNVEECEFKKI